MLERMMNMKADVAVAAWLNHKLVAGCKLELFYAPKGWQLSRGIQSKCLSNRISILKNCFLQP